MKLVLVTPHFSASNVGFLPDLENFQKIQRWLGISIQVLGNEKTNNSKPKVRKYTFAGVPPPALNSTSPRSTDTHRSSCDGTARVIAGKTVKSLRRGFKTWCENAARGYRRNLSLQSRDALDPQLLANHLGVKIWRTVDVPGIDPNVVRQLTVIGSDSWSAVTLRLTGSDLILVNETHVLGRQNYTIAHELSHIILNHEPTQVFFTPNGLMMLAHYNKTFEKEADCLAGTLLVPRKVFFYLDEGRDERWLAKYFGVTTKLIQMRRNLTGVDL